jgi:hypothetical protein
LRAVEHKGARPGIDFRRIGVCFTPDGQQALVAGRN